MTNLFPLTPRYRLDDESAWLLGIDPLRSYWLAINGDSNFKTRIPGIDVSSNTGFKQIIKNFKGLTPNHSMTLESFAGSWTIHHIADNCYGVEVEEGYSVWHLFDYESLFSLLMTNHPDWQSSSSSMAIGLTMLNNSWDKQPVLA